MAVVIRMKRTGRRKRPCYRISVTDRSFPRDGRTLETLGAVWFRIAPSSSMSSPPKAGSPARASNRTRPAEYTSVRASTADRTNGRKK